MNLNETCLTGLLVICSDEGVVVLRVLIGLCDMTVRMHVLCDGN